MMKNAWNRMCALDDEFFGMFISISNIGISFLIHFSLWMLGAFINDRYAQLKGSYINTLNHTPASLYLPFSYGFICGILVILCIVLVYQKSKNNNIVKPQIGNFNNVATNKPLVTWYQTAAFLFIVFCFAFFYFTMKLRIFGKNPLVDITVFMFCFVLFPLILVPNKKKCIKFLLREIFSAN